jgi:hypothetical protein
MYLTNDYRDIIEIFNEHEVRYLVTGAYAMAVFGYARSTYDIDIWIDKREENVEKVLAALDEFGVPFVIDSEDLKRDYAVIQIGVAPVRIDLLTDIDGVDFDDAYAQSVRHDFGGLEATILHLDDILKNKIATNRSKDKIDVIELNRLKEMNRKEKSK